MTGDAAAEKDAVGSLLLKMVSCSARKSAMRGAEMLRVGANTMPTIKCQTVVQVSLNRIVGEVSAKVIGLTIS